MGYTYNIKVYVGKNAELQKTVPADIMSLAGDLLVEQWLWCNWYTSLVSAHI